jgi:hypothetical protein
MAKRCTFATVEELGRALPDVEVTTMFACMASHKSAEPESLVVMMDFAERDALVADAPDTYYLKEHYLNYPCVLVRLARVRADALRDLVVGAHRYVAAQTRAKRSAKPRRGPGVSARRQP